MKPKSLEKLITSLNFLPGISKKQAEKLAYNIVSSNQNEAKQVAENINDALKKIKNCKICGYISDEDVCSICNDKSRSKILVIVESSLDVFKFEDSKNIRPYYHVLNGLINVSNKINFQDLNLENLKSRSKNMNEIIIALSPNMEGIVTANYIKSLLNNEKVTQLAQGIPLGAAMEYVDKLTLKVALDNRKEVK